MLLIGGVGSIIIARPWKKIYKFWSESKKVNYFWYYLFFSTFDFAKLGSVLSLLFHHLFALIKFGQEILLRPNHWGAILWKCSVEVHTADFLATTLFFLARNPRPWRRRRLTSARCHHWATNGLLSRPGKKNKKEDSRIHWCHHPKRFVLYSMWIGGTPPYLYTQTRQ